MLKSPGAKLELVSCDSFFGIIFKLHVRNKKYILKLSLLSDPKIVYKYGGKKNQQTRLTTFCKKQITKNKFGKYQQ